MNIILAFFKFLVLFVYFLFLWDSILGIKYKLFDLDSDDDFLFNVIYVAYTFFNLILVMKFFHF